MSLKGPFATASGRTEDRSMSGTQRRPKSRRFVSNLSRDVAQLFKGSGQSALSRVLRGVYLARFNTTSATPPLDAAVVHLSSSPMRVIGRLCLAPFQLGNVLVSM